MIENVNASREASASMDFTNFNKYIGVASVNILAINPNNEKLRKLGWSVPEGADEPKYIFEGTDNNGKAVKSARVRLLAQIQDLEDKPIVSLDFWCRSNVMVNKTGDKAKIIDAYGRTAWATKPEIEQKKIPLYSNGQAANISTPYKLCHQGEEELVRFLYKYLNITPLQLFNRQKNAWENTKNPGRLTIDNWQKLCDGDVTEIASYLAMMPNNKVKVVLGVNARDDNKSYQTFLTDGYIGNGASININTGEYDSARKLIDKFREQRNNADSYSFAATPIKVYEQTATDVQEKPALFDDNGNYAIATPFDDDLPM